jgi:hypothetical protein
VFAVPPLGHLSDPLPAVGELIANTRTPDDPTIEYLTEGTPEWADPPFLRVVEVLPIVDTEGFPAGLTDFGVPVGTDVDHVEIIGYEGAPIVTRWDWCEGDQAYSCDRHPYFDLPGAAPGGWAIRVEAADPSEIHGETLAWGATSPTPTGRPLNEVAA